MYQYVTNVTCNHYCNLLQCSHTWRLQMERYEISECNEYDIMPYGFTVWAIGNDSAGIPYSRQVGWYATREEAEQDISNHS